ncbi:MAG: hypothetical protein AB8B64_21750 [Granulosicoccus sp.]
MPGSTLFRQSLQNFGIDALRRHITVTKSAFHHGKLCQCQSAAGPMIIIFFIDATDTLCESALSYSASNELIAVVDAA